ncbi:MAG: hypothetical protein J0H79_13910 [Alphaproteobacteria bacterium]|nr:hypothetical protein [Alphaproteobacteria bacterium]
MPSIYADRVKDTSSAQSAALITLAGAAPSGFQSFGSAVGDGNVCVYVVQDASGNWEVSCGVYTAAAKTLARAAAPIASSNAGAQVAAFSGTVTVFLTDPAAHVRAMDWGLPAGRMYTNSWLEGSSVSSSTNPGQDALNLPGVWIRQWFTKVKLHVNFVTLSGTTGVTMDIGLYDTSPVNAMPNRLLASQTGIPADSTGVTGDNASAWLNMPSPQPPGLYWPGCRFTSGSPVMRGFNGQTTLASKTLYGITNTTDTGQIFGWALKFPPALPDPFYSYAGSLAPANNGMPFYGVEVSF